MLFSIFQQTVKCKDSGRYKAMRFQKVEVVMIDAEFDIFTSLLLFFYKASSQASTACINNRATLLLLDRRVETQIFSTRQSQATEFFLFT